MDQLGELFLPVGSATAIISISAVTHGQPGKLPKILFANLVLLVLLAMIVGTKVGALAKGLAWVYFIGALFTRGEPFIRWLTQLVEGFGNAR